MTPTEVTLPDWPYGSLMPVLFSEAAAAFEELTLSGRLTQLKVQVPDAWPNLFRAGAVSLGGGLRAGRSPAPHASRWRWRASSREVDLLLVPSLRDEMLTISNFTGHPSLTLRAGFVERVGGAQRLGARSERTRCRSSRRRAACRTA